MKRAFLADAQLDERSALRLILQETYPAAAVIVLSRPVQIRLSAKAKRLGEVAERLRDAVASIYSFRMTPPAYPDHDCSRGGEPVGEKQFENPAHYTRSRALM